MADIIPLFTKASQFQARPADPRLEKPKSFFSMFIQEKINFFNDRFEPGEKKIMGGFPSLNAADPLAEILVIFLSNEALDKARGNWDETGMMSRLIDTLSQDSLLFGPRLNITTPRGELSRGSKFLAACLLPRVLNVGPYMEFKTPLVAKSIAELILEEGRGFLHCATGMTASNPYFDYGMADFCQRLLGVRVFGQRDHDTSVGHHVMNALKGIAREDFSRLPSPMQSH